MPIEFDKKELVKYPFLKEAHSLVGSRAYALNNLLELESGKRLAQKARDRIKAALSMDYVFDNVAGSSGDIPEHEILSYAIARMIVSCMNERPVIDKLCRYESERAAYFLKHEEPAKKEYIARSLGIDLRSGQMSVREYVELVRDIRDAKWQLVNRDVNAGNVAVSRDEAEELLKERIRSMLHGQLPLPVPDEIGDIRVLPGKDIHHPGDRPGFGGIQLCDLGIGVGAVEEAGIEHIRFHIVRSELGDARRHGIGKHPGQIGLAYDLKILPQSVYACIIRHSADLLIPIPVCPFGKPA